MELLRHQHLDKCVVRYQHITDCILEAAHDRGLEGRGIMTADDLQAALSKYVATYHLCQLKSSHVLCCAVLCCAVLCCAVLCRAVLCPAVPSGLLSHITPQHSTLEIAFIACSMHFADRVVAFLAVVMPPASATKQAFQKSHFT